MKVKAVYVGKFNDGSQTYNLCKQKNPQLKEDLQKIPNKIKVLNAKAGQRNKLNTNYGSWFVLQQGGWGYAVCVNDQYPERHAYGLIDKIKEYVESNKTNMDGKFMKGLKKKVDENTQKYADLTKIDKVHKAQAEVNMLQNELHTGVSKLMSGKENLQQLDERALQMKSFAKEFEKNCSQLQSVTFWHKWKFIMLIGLIVLGMISLVAITIMIRY